MKKVLPVGQKQYISYLHSSVLLIVGIDCNPLSNIIIAFSSIYRYKIHKIWHQIEKWNHPVRSVFYSIFQPNSLPMHSDEMASHLMSSHTNLPGSENSENDSQLTQMDHSDNIDGKHFILYHFIYNYIKHIYNFLFNKNKIKRNRFFLNVLTIYKW